MAKLSCGYVYVLCDVAMIRDQRELYRRVAEVTERQHNIFVGKMLDAILAKPYVGRVKLIPGDVKYTKDLSRRLVISAMFLIQANDKRRNDIASNIFHARLKVDSSHPVEIATRDINEATRINLGQKMFQLMSEYSC